MVNARLIFYDNWEGGISAGSLCFANGAFLVRFSDGSRKSFNPLYYGNEAKRSAEEWRSEQSLSKNLTRNRYRHVYDTKEGDYVEVKLQDDFVAKIDTQDLFLLNQCTWSAKPAHDRFYMHHSERRLKGLKSNMFHRLIFPNWTVIDHINRNGLDNRRKNLRNGKPNELHINNRNQKKRHDNSSGKTGVHYSKCDNTWIVQYPCNGKRCKKSYSVSKYGDEEAKKLAINFRKDIDKKYNINNGYDSE